MDDSLMPTAAAEPHSDDVELRTGERPLPTNGRVAVPAPPVPPNSTRRPPIWALVGGLAAIAIAFGGGYAINAGDADGVRDDLNTEIHTLEKELEDVEGTRSATASALDRCRDAVESATALTAAADDLADYWQQVQTLAVQYLTAPEGSAEEARIDAELTELESQMSGKMGALSASADRVATDSESCEAA